MIRITAIRITIHNEGTDFMKLPTPETIPASDIEAWKTAYKQANCLDTDCEIDLYFDNL